MAVKIRLARGGKKKQPFYRIVAADSRAKRDGRFLEKLGFYNPMNKDLSLNQELVTKWLGVGAIPTEKVARLIEKQGIEIPVNILKKCQAPQKTAKKKENTK